MNNINKFIGGATAILASVSAAHAIDSVDLSKDPLIYGVPYTPSEQVRYSPKKKGECDILEMNSIYKGIDRNNCTWESAFGGCNDWVKPKDFWNSREITDAQRGDVIRSTRAHLSAAGCVGVEGDSDRRVEKSFKQHAGDIAEDAGKKVLENIFSKLF